MTIRYPHPSPLVPPPGSGPDPRVSVCVPTRERGPKIAATLTSLSRLEHDSFEVIVVDQSENNLCAEACDATVGADPRFTYVHSDTVGRSASCNIGLKLAKGQIVAFTDDDCIVPPHWLSLLEGSLTTHPRVAIVAAAIIPTAHDASRSFSPFFTPRGGHLHRSPWLAYRAAGIGGANLSFRNAPLMAIGGFDEVLGVGAPLRAAEDFDILYRLLRAGHHALVLPQPAVLHDEQLAWSGHGKKLLRNYAFAEGAQCMKHVRCGDPAAVACLVALWFRKLHLGHLARLERGAGVGTFLAFALGALGSFRYRVNRQRRVYNPRTPRRWQHGYATVGLPPAP